MSVMGRVIGAILRPILEQQAKGRTPEDFARSLEHSGKKVSERLDQVPDTSHNREVAHHIVGIERWGSHRLRIALGEPFVLDSYRGYRLPEGSDLPTLRLAFADTRKRTVILVWALRAVDPALQTKVRHNDAGDLSVAGWLAYLEGHAKRESRRLKS